MNSQSQVGSLVDLGDRIIRDSFVDQHGEPIVVIDCDDGRCAVPLREREFFRTLRAASRAEGNFPAARVLKEAVEYIAAAVSERGVRKETAVRVAGDEALVELDLGVGRFAQVTAEGWEVVGESKNQFVSVESAKPLPDPIRGGSLDLLRRFFRSATDDYGWMLIRALLIDLLRPFGSRPIALFEGEQGSGKSTGARWLKSVVDPTTPLLRGGKLSEEGLMIATRSNLVIAYDNASHLTGAQSDLCCRLSTGMGFGKRTLYENAEETTFEAARYQIFTSIGQITNRADFIDRAVRVQYPSMTAGENESDARLAAEFEDIHGLVLGALLDHASAALRNLPEVQLAKSPRLRDFAEWGVAAVGVEGEFLLECLMANRQSQSDDAIASNPVALVILEMAEKAHGGVIEEAPSALYDLASDWLARSTSAEPIRIRRDWPRSAVSFGQMLSRVAPELRAHGVEVAQGGMRGTGNGKRRVTRITLIEEPVADEEIPF